MRYAVVAVGYNRPGSMKRLLDSLCNANYDTPCDLIISLDYGKDQEKLIEIGKTVDWKYGEKKIRAFKENQKLRNHILQCGDLTDEYDAVIVLEDDLVVAEGFFRYVTEAVEFYKDDDSIAGISLYTHRTNLGNGRPFEAQFNGYDVFLMQYAMSWGQCWTRKQWRGFREWYNIQDDIADDGVIPSYVVAWNQQSWLKYYIRYTAEKGMFHVYPYFSLSTNGSEVGEHNDQKSNAYQVPLVYGNVKNYRFPTTKQAVKYDSYFERMFEDSDLLQFQGKVLMDLYGLRKQYKDAEVLISTQVLDYRIVKKFGLQYRPHELNVFYQEAGDGIYLYDLKFRQKNPDKENKLWLVSYDVKAEPPRMTLLHGWNGMNNSIKTRLKRKLKRK